LIFFAPHARSIVAFLFTHHYILLYSLGNKPTYRAKRTKRTCPPGRREKAQAGHNNDRTTGTAIYGWQGSPPHLVVFFPRLLKPDPQDTETDRHNTTQRGMVPETAPSKKDILE